jgi:Ca-activated chloride channel family protein
VQSFVAKYLTWASLASCIALLFGPIPGRLLAQSPATTRPTFRADSQLVLVPVTVTDRDHKTISGLRPQNFTIFEDQAPQQVASFSSEDAPCSVGLVIDTSGSMRRVLGTAKYLAHSFFGAANSADDFLLLTVSTEPEPVSGFTTDTAALEQGIQSARPGGLTALIDTVYLALDRMRKAQQPRRALLIFSDGLDNHSRYSKGELMRVAVEANVQIYTIIINTGPGGTPTGPGLFRPGLAAKPIDQARANQEPQLLEDLSDKTGGLHFRVRNEGEAEEAAIAVSHAIHNEYVIGFHPSNTSSSGKWHSIRVKADVPKVHVYTRSGYYSQ